MDFELQINDMDLEVEINGDFLIPFDYNGDIECKDLTPQMIFELQKNEMELEVEINGDFLFPLYYNRDIASKDLTSVELSNLDYFLLDSPICIDLTDDDDDIRPLLKRKKNLLTATKVLIDYPCNGVRKGKGGPCRNYTKIGELFCHFHKK